MVDKVLVAVAHPDDEVLGCGGTIAKLAAAGLEVCVAVLADGIASRRLSDTAMQSALKTRRECSRKAIRILGARSVTFGDLPDNALDTVALLEITQHVESLIEHYQPKIIFTHHIGDLNIDHRRVHQAVITACRPQKGHPVQRILCFEVPSSTEWQIPGSGEIFAPNWFVDISQTLTQKIAALEAYAAELRDWPHPRSLKAVQHLAHWRGATVGCDAAEAFVLARQLQ
jgi:LmbE family N-acetylglucosaminyl deacetylase